MEKARHLARRRALRDIDDVALVALLVERNPLAQRIAWQRLAPMVRRMLTRVFGNVLEVDDLVQDTFLLLFKCVHQLRDPQALRAYVVSITVGGIRHALRHKTIGRARFVPKDADAIAAPFDLDARKAVDRLESILGQLRACDRSAFVQRFVEGRELSAISTALGVSVSTIKRRVARAWKRVIFHSRADASLAGYVGSGLMPRHP